MRLTPMLLLPTLVFSKVSLREVDGPVCSLQLRNESPPASIERTNDWTIVPSTSNTLWPSANFFLTLNSTIFGGNGQVCTFSPYFRCQSEGSTTNVDRFKIMQNTTVTWNGGSKFWFCPDPDGDAHHMVAAPLIYPPKGYLIEGDEPDYDDCNSTMLYSNACLNQTEFRLDPLSVALNSDKSPQEGVTGGVGQLTWSLANIVVSVSVTSFLHRL